MYLSVFSSFMERRMNELIKLKDNQIKDTKQKSLIEVKLLLRETAIEMARSMETKPNQSLSSIIARIIKERYQSMINNGNYEE